MSTPPDTRADGPYVHARRSHIWYNVPMSKATDTQRLAARFTPEDPLRVTLITLSNRAHAGVYEDTAGQRLHDRLDAFFAEAKIAHAIDTDLMPDDPQRLERALTTARDHNVPLVVTTGGTGVAPTDITPDTVLMLADKTIPGVMEHIRAKYGAQKPLALLSRSVAAVLGQTLVYTLPGNPKAIDEYLDELLKTLPHTLCLLNDINPH